jgi:hypothetical protein
MSAQHSGQTEEALLGPSPSLAFAWSRRSSVSHSRAMNASVVAPDYFGGLFAGVKALALRAGDSEHPLFIMGGFKRLATLPSAGGFEYYGLMSWT